MKHEKIAQAAAEWWANALKNPSFDNGESSAGGQPLAGLLALMGSPSHSDECLEAFTASLAERIEAELASGRYNSFGFRIGVDYHPDPMLAEAAAEAGLESNGLSTFPWKTCMLIENGIVEVSAGYGSPMKQIYPN